jgi:hypothetical protein
MYFSKGAREMRRRRESGVDEGEKYILRCRNQHRRDVRRRRELGIEMDEWVIWDPYALRRRKPWVEQSSR